MNGTISITFSVWSPKFTPAEITRRFGINADLEALKGAERIPSRNVPVANGWHLISECAGDMRAEQCLDRLIQRTLSVRSALDQLLKEDAEASCKITVYFSRGRADCSIELAPVTLATLASLSATVFIDTVELTEGSA